MFIVVLGLSPLFRRGQMFIVGFGVYMIDFRKTITKSCTLIFVKLLMMFATKGQSEATSLLSMTWVRLWTSHLLKPPEPFNGVGVMEIVVAVMGLLNETFHLP